MSDLSKTLGNFSAGHVLKCGDKVYRMRIIDQSVKDAYAKALFGQAREALNEIRDDLTREEYVARLDKLLQAFEQGEFKLEGGRGMSALSTTRGSILLFSLILDVDETEAMNVLSANQDESAVMLELVMRESFPYVKFGEKKNRLPRRESGLALHQGGNPGRPVRTHPCRVRKAK